jgi:serine/threonine protein kinase
MREIPKELYPSKSEALHWNTQVKPWNRAIPGMDNFCAIDVVRELGRGVYGVALEVKVNDKLVALLNSLKRTMTHVVFQSLPALDIGATIALKVQTYPGGGPSEWLRNCYRENQIHKYLSSHGCVNVGFMQLCPSKHVPGFFMSGFARDWRGQFYITAMEKVTGVPVFDVTDGMQDINTAAQMRFYNAVETALASLWAVGVFHGDAHYHNMFYNKSTGKVTMLDFGYSVLIRGPRKVRLIRAALERSIQQGLPIYAILHGRSPYRVPGVSEFINRAMKARGAEFYHENGTRLHGLLKELTNQNKNKNAMNSSNNNNNAQNKMQAKRKRG